MTPFRSGFASLVGRPNVGKSTLLNQICRAKVSIVSEKPQTTRNAVRGIYTAPDAQIVFVDTPGFHKPRTVLGRRLNEVVLRTLREVDVVVFVLDASQGVGRGDAFIAEALGGIATPVVVAVNKVDLLRGGELEGQLEAARALGRWERVLAVSARTGRGVEELVAAIVGLLPEGPMYYPPGMVSDRPEAVVVAELIREKLLALTREEVPHSIAVVVEDMSRRPDANLVDIDAVIYVERPSQKGIVIGAGGRVLRQAGTAARQEIEALLGTRVFLRLRVKVEPDWQKRAALIERFGYGT